MSYKKINNIVGWVVCLIACTVYILTKEKSASFWDCGEFLSGSYKLEVVHSPGAPLFLLIGRLFTMFGDAKSAAANVNTLSALASGFTILFLFWSITHFARRACERMGWEVSGGNLVAIMASGVVGGLAYTFSDTFWFSAVEGEVYALSSMLTALVFWAILKWEDQTKDQDPTNKRFADRWIILIFFIVGLSIGVHLLNLLAIPAIVMVYYFARYKFSIGGAIAAFLIGVVALGIVQKGIIQKIPALAGYADLVFVNDFKMPFNSGALFVLFLVLAVVFLLIRFFKSKGWYEAHLAMVSFLFVIIGYSSYLMIIIRSSADVPIDMTNPDNPLALVKYLEREQYGNTPLLFGPDYNSRPNDVKYSDENYVKGKDSYIPTGKNITEYEFSSDQKRFFPRLWDMNDPRHVQFYKDYCNIPDGERPTAGHNLSFFIRYQCIQMYWRYFCWNYIGRQNDIQNLRGEPDAGNWLSGIGFIDRLFGHGDSDKLPEGIKNSMARNELYGLPFILGILGLIFQVAKDKRNAFIVGLLFFMTGFAIVIYLNNTPLQPRERDYAYAGSTYAFAIWIGLGVMQLYEWFRKAMGAVPAAAIAGGLSLVAVPLLMASKEWDDHDRSKKTLAPASARNFLECCDKNAILFTEGDNDTYPLWYLQEIEGVRTDVRVINLSLLGIDWYINQLNYKINDADKVDMHWKPDDYLGNKMGYVSFQAGGGVSPDQYVDIRDMIDYLAKNAAQLAASGSQDDRLTIPTRNVFLAGKDSNSSLKWTLPEGTFLKNDIAIWNIVASNFGKRPIYFSNTIDPKHYEGLYPYLEQEGIVYKLTPRYSGATQVGMPTPVNTKKSYDLYMKTFQFGGAERSDIFYDQTNRRMLNIIRNGASRVADALSNEGKKKEALEVLNHTMKNMSERSYPYSLSDEERNIVYVIGSYIKAGGKAEAEKIVEKLFAFHRAQVNYNNSLTGNAKELHRLDVESGIQTLSFIPGMVANAGDSTYAKQIQERVTQLAGGAAAPGLISK